MGIETHPAAEATLRYLRLRHSFRLAYYGIWPAYCKAEAERHEHYDSWLRKAESWPACMSDSLLRAADIALSLRLGGARRNS